MSFHSKNLAKSSADAVLVSSDGVEFPCHKVYLSNNSLVFEDMFSSTSQARVNFEEMDSVQLEDFLKCIYSPAGKNPLNLDNVKPLTEAARKYHMPALLTASDDFCSREVGLSNDSFLDWAAFAFEYELPAFSKKCEAYAVSEDTSELLGNLLLRPEGSIIDKAATCVLKSAQQKLQEATSARNSLRSNLF